MRKKPRRGRTFAAKESQAVEVLTVGWMLTVLATLGCELAWLAAMTLAAWRPAAVQIELLGRLLLFAGGVSGLVSIGLAGAVVHLRREPPPRPITAVSLAIALLPLAALAWILLK